MANLEKIILSGLNFNDEVKLAMEALNFIPAQAKTKLAENPNADGVLLVEEPQYTPSYFEMQVRVVNGKPGMDEALATVGEVIDALTACAKIEGGAGLEWLPAESTQTYTAYALVGELLEIPITTTGDLAGWFVKFPVLKIKLTCRPFLFLDERVVLTMTESTGEPLQVVYIKNIQGDVPAEGRLLVKDTATAGRRFAQWGRDVVETEVNPPILLTAASGLTGAGFSGTLTTRAGAYSAEKVLRGLGISQATTLCGTGRIEDIGSYAVYMRVFAPSSKALFRIAYRNGDSPLGYLPWQSPILANGWSDLFMGELSLDEVERGVQTSELRVEHRVTEGSTSNDVNYLTLIPITESAGKARGMASNVATNLVAFDYFEQTAGNLEGKELTYPSVTWSETNKTGAEGFLTTGVSTIKRTKVSDTNIYSGCFALAGAFSLSTFVSSVVLKKESMMRATGLYGLLGRYVSPTKWLVAGLTTTEFGVVTLKVIKYVEGTPTELGAGAAGPNSIEGGVGGHLSIDLAIRFSVSANGSWVAQCGTALLTGQDSSLASGGVLASGKCGLYDGYAMPLSGTRTMDSFELLGGEEAGVVCYPGRQAEFNSEGCKRQDATGVYMGPPSVYRGAGFQLEPAGKLGLINRLAVRMRRNDIVAEEDTNVTDKHAIEVLARERFLSPR